MNTAIRELAKRTLELRTNVAALQNDISAVQQQVNQLSNSLAPAAPSEPEVQPSSPPDVLPLYARRIGFANHTEVEAAYNRNPADFIVQVKAALSDSLVPYLWDNAESVSRMKRFFTDAGITLDLLELGEVQNKNFRSVAEYDLVVRGDMVVRHLRAHNWVREEFVLFWTLLEICRQYGIVRQARLHTAKLRQTDALQHGETSSLLSNPAYYNPEVTLSYRF
ncbi:hypothetical protein BBK36DRAFT_17417 [Trichoderma citrinoviride]|uniref:Uncharacterized protein n=1 Tax=Trichoderma citrinoviride TaxID=58853 RepID=A0A2T4BL89_9HYPO|nr:hypothetical protein BBK36DRAFT_17417 [Trichoderma citrinoviride]PTB70084.1 hypothetical protein BBK36DRAFT_17417 [Trichoderma citrinoviride]